MSLTELAASQPVAEGPTPAEQETGMTGAENQGEQASETPVNSDVNNQDTETVEVEDSDRIQKRINKLVGERNTAQNELLQEKAAREAIERNMDHFQRDDSSKEKTLADLDVAALEDFLVRARADEELQEHVPEAQRHLTEKRIEMGINKFKTEQRTDNEVKEGQDLTNLLLNNLAGERLRDTESDYFLGVQTTLGELTGDQFNNVNKDQLLAVALAEVKRLSVPQSAPTVSDRVVQNRNNNNMIISNNRAATSGNSDLETFLAENKSLRRSKQGSTDGGLKTAISKLKIMDTF